MTKEYYAVYSNEGDMTFIMEDTFDGDEVIATTVTGFYFGTPDEESTELFKFSRTARFEMGRE